MTFPVQLKWVSSLLLITPLLLVAAMLQIARVAGSLFADDLPYDDDDAIGYHFVADGHALYEDPG